MTHKRRERLSWIKPRKKAIKPDRIIIPITR